MIITTKSRRGATEALPLSFMLVCYERLAAEYLKRVHYRISGSFTIWTSVVFCGPWPIPVGRLDTALIDVRR